MLNEKGEVLLGRHINKAKARRVHWIMPGGKVELGEDIPEAAKREAFEECGIKVGDLKIISVSRDKVPAGKMVTIGFLAQKFSGTPKVLEPQEIDQWRWFSLDKPPKPLFPPSRKIIENYKARRLYNIKEAEKAQGQS